MSFGFVKKICPDKIINYENFELLNEKDPVQTSQQLKPCLEGKDIGLLTDAGCPNIADPGSKLILHAHQNNINVIPLVGPSSILPAMMSSGLNGNNFASVLCGLERRLRAPSATNTVGLFPSHARTKPNNRRK